MSPKAQHCPVTVWLGSAPPSCALLLHLSFQGCVWVPITVTLQQPSILANSIDTRRTMCSFSSLPFLSFWGIAKSSIIIYKHARDTYKTGVMMAAWNKANGALLGIPHQRKDALDLLQPEYTLGLKATLLTLCLDHTRPQPRPIISWATSFDYQSE